MPTKEKNLSKKNNSESQSSKVADPKEVEIPDDENEIPDLEFVSNTTKERYEYKPVLRAEIIYKDPKERCTSEVMTKFEMCEVKSIRAKQLEQGKTVFTDIGGLTDPLAIAEKEIIDKKCPLSIVRMITDKIAEKWQVNEMAIPYDSQELFR